MIRRRGAWIGLLVIAVLSVAMNGVALADLSLSLNGEFAPGALIVGKTAAGNAVTQDGQTVRVSSRGELLLGLARDASGETIVTVTSPNGEVTTYEYDVANREYDIQHIDGLPSKQVSPDPETLERIAADSVLIKMARKNDLNTPLFQSGFVWPLTGRISGVYGSQRVLNGSPRSPHNGVDIAAPTGTLIQAMADGRVSLVHEDMFYTGKTIILDHGHGLTSVYIHMSEILRTHGDMVAKGDVIGKVGQTGRATGPHLHWGVTLFSTHLDPMLVAGPMPDQ